MAALRPAGRPLAVPETGRASRWRNREVVELQHALRDVIAASTRLYLVAEPRLEDLLVRLARLADDTPDLAELDLDPVIVTTTTATAVDAKIRLTPAPTGRSWSSTTAPR